MAKRTRKPKAEKTDVTVIFRPWRTLKDGRRIYAATYGFKVWPIKIRDGVEIP